MSKLTITRSRQFYGAYSKCWIFYGLNEDEAKKIIIKFRKKPQLLPANIIPIINGQTLSIEINDEMSAFYAASMIPVFSKQVSLSNKITVDKDCSGKSYFFTLLENSSYNRKAGKVLQLTEMHLC